MGINGSPQVPVTMPRDPRIAGLSAPVAAEHNRLHYPQILCLQEIDAVLEFIARAFIGIEFKKHPSSVYPVYLCSTFFG